MNLALHTIFMASLLLVALGFKSTQASAAMSSHVKMFKTRKAYEIKTDSGDKVLKIPQDDTIKAEKCSVQLDKCRIAYEVDGQIHRFILPMSELEGVSEFNARNVTFSSSTLSDGVTEESRSTSSSQVYSQLPVVYASSSDELGVGESSGIGQFEPSTALGKSSDFLNCYKRHKKTYTQKLSCKNKKGQRYWCGTKSVLNSSGLCYKYTKHLLSRCDSTDYWSDSYAKDAGPHLLAQGFKKLRTNDPSKAPLGSVIVYNNSCTYTHRAGHIEIKLAQNEYVSDYIAEESMSSTTKCRPVSGIYFK